MGMIKLKNVSKYYYSKGIIASGISRVNLDLDTGEFVVITGESGRRSDFGRTGRYRFPRFILRLCMRSQAGTQAQASSGPQNLRRTGW